MTSSLGAAWWCSAFLAPSPPCARPATCLVRSVPASAKRDVCLMVGFAGYVEKLAEFKAKGVDEIVCITPNDKYVSNAWSKDQKAGSAVTVVADGNLSLTRALNMEEDMRKVGFGPRSNRYAMHVVNGVVKQLFAEENSGKFEVSDAEKMLAAI
jgi:glutaredoxin/glutathione-dependent peroxiredoxin